MFKIVRIVKQGPKSIRNALWRSRVECAYLAHLALRRARALATGAAGQIRPVRVGLLVAALAIVVAPSFLYLQERARRQEMGRAYGSLGLWSHSEISRLRYAMGSLADEQSQLRRELLDLGYSVLSGNELSIPVTVTAYSSTVIETDDTPFVTASNTMVRSGVIAMSRDLLRRYTPGAPFEFGDVVHITGLGDLVVEDSMNPRWSRRVDVWFPDRAAAFGFGHRRMVMHAPAGEREAAAIRARAVDEGPSHRIDFAGGEPNGASP